MRAKSAGCHGSVNRDNEAAIRSAAKAYWLRSLVPIDKKST